MVSAFAPCLLLKRVYIFKLGQLSNLTPAMLGGLQDVGHIGVATGRSALSRCSYLVYVQLQQPAPRGHKPNHSGNLSISCVIRLMLVGAEQAASAFRFPHGSFLIEVESRGYSKMKKDR